MPQLVKGGKYVFGWSPVTEDGRINLRDPELLDWLTQVTPESEAVALESDPALPLLMMAGWHMDTNANTLKLFSA